MKISQEVIYLQRIRKDVLRCLDFKPVKAIKKEKAMVMDKKLDGQRGNEDTKESFRDGRQKL